MQDFTPVWLNYWTLWFDMDFVALQRPSLNASVSAASRNAGYIYLCSYTIQRPSAR